jgi:hypothetical protein
MRTLLVGLLIMLGACGSRTEGPSSEGVDSASATNPDSVLLDSNRVLGYDSAFGPKFSVDSTGKLVDLPRPTP